MVSLWDPPPVDNSVVCRSLESRLDRSEDIVDGGTDLSLRPGVCPEFIDGTGFCGANAESAARMGFAWPRPRPRRASGIVREVRCVWPKQAIPVFLTQDTTKTQRRSRGPIAKPSLSIPPPKPEVTIYVSCNPGSSHRNTHVSRHDGSTDFS